jgi:methyltransferase
VASLNGTAVSIAVATAIAVFLLMAGEAVLSRVNESALRRLGAVEPPGDVHHIMRWVYPGAFVAMALEGAWFGPAPPWAILAGLTTFGLAKALKLWAVASLGERWSFRVLVLPGRPLVVSGPYRWLRHPNYLAVIGEIVAVALTVGAPITGGLSAIGFGALIRRRIAVEEQALGRQ